MLLTQVNSPDERQVNSPDERQVNSPGYWPVKQQQRGVHSAVSPPLAAAVAVGPVVHSVGGFGAVNPAAPPPGPETSLTAGPPPSTVRGPSHTD